MEPLSAGLAAGINLFAAGLFAAAAWHKIRTFRAFTGFVRDYRLVPEWLVVPIGAGLVMLEAVSVPTALTAAPPLAWLPAGLLTLYGIAMAINRVRGRRQIDCGCGSRPMNVSWVLVGRNLSISVALLWSTTHPPPWSVLSDSDPVAAFLVLAFAGGLGLLYATANQLEANRAYMMLQSSRSV